MCKYHVVFTPMYRKEGAELGVWRGTARGGYEGFWYKRRDFMRTSFRPTGPFSRCRDSARYRVITYGSFGGSALSSAYDVESRSPTT